MTRRWMMIKEICLMFLLRQKLALLFTALFITCDYTSTFSPTTWVLFWCCCIVHGSDIYPPLICVVSLSTMGPGSCLNRYKALAVSLAVLAAFLLAVDIGLGVYCKWLLQAAVFVILRNFLNLKKKRFNRRENNHLLWENRGQQKGIWFILTWLFLSSFNSLVWFSTL